MCDLFWQKTWIIRAINWHNWNTTFFLFPGTWTSRQDHLTTRWVRAALQSVPRVWCFSSIYCLTEDLRESSPQFLECRGPLLCPSRLRSGCAWAQLCSVLWLMQQRRSCSVLFRLVASFSPLRVVVHFWVFVSPVSAKTLPLISSSLLIWLVCVCSRIGCSQQRVTVGLAYWNFLSLLIVPFYLAENALKSSCVHFLKCPWVGSSFRYFQQVKRQWTIDVYFSSC